MKMKFMTVLLSASAIFASEQMPTTSELPLEVKHKLVDTRLNSSWFSYMRVAVSDSRPNEMVRVLPGLGLGLRFGLPVGSLDLSASYTGTDVGMKGSYFYTLPRMAYFMYASPKKEQSFYFGPGLAYGSMKTLKTATQDSQTFNGLIPSLSVGYEMNRHQNWHSFFQVDVSQPAFSTSYEKPYTKLASATLGPIVEGSVGFGY